MNAIEIPLPTIVSGAAEAIFLAPSFLEILLFRIPTGN